MKKIILLTFCLIHSICMAATCPSIANLKKQNLQEWQALDINSGSPISTNELHNYLNHITHFALAEWMSQAPEGEAHCYYIDNRNGYGDVFLAKANLKPLSNGHWIKINADVAQCKSERQSCVFQHA